MKRKPESKSVKFKGVDPDKGEDTDTGSGAKFGRTGQIQNIKKSKVGAYKSLSEQGIVGVEIGIPPRVASAKQDIQTPRHHSRDWRDIQSNMTRTLTQRMDCAGTYSTKL
jgi:hypothetical protein